jgi:hypothetical protein
VCVSCRSMQRAGAMLSSVVCPALTHFFHIIPQTARFSGGKKSVAHEVCFDFLCNFETFLILRRTERGMILSVYWSLCKAPVYFCQSWMKIDFSLQIFKKYPNMKFHFKKTRRVGAELFHTDRRRDRHDEANSCPSHFCESRLKMNHAVLYREVIAVLR